MRTYLPDSLSSDERMLQLIQGKAGGDPSGDEKILNLVAQKKDPNNLSDYEKNILSSDDKASKSSAKKGAFGNVLKSINLKWVNQLLVVLVIVFIGLVLFQYFTFLGGLANESSSESEAKAVSWKAPNQEPAYTESQLLDEVSKRNIFREGQHSLVQGMTYTTTSEATPTFDQISLVGIIWSERRPQAIVEDTTTNETLFVTVGDEVAGGKITKISRNSFMIEVQGREYKIESK